MSPEDGPAPAVLREKRGRQRSRLIDCNVHHALRSL